MYSINGLLGENNALFFLIIVITYFIGNISPSTLIAKSSGVDIKREGSGNAGTANALRVLGFKSAAVTLLIDVLKGTLAVLLGGILLGHTPAMYCLLSVICGHVWPVMLHFKGGKGVATAFGALMGLNPALGLAALGAVVLGVLVSRRMSVGSLAGSVACPFLIWFLEPDFMIPGTIMACIIFFNHRDNIVRMYRGEEPKINLKRKK